MKGSWKTFKYEKKFKTKKNTKKVQNQGKT